MEGLNTKRGYTNFELSCCLDNIITQYEEQLEKNKSEEELAEKIDLLIALREHIDSQKEQLLFHNNEEKNNNVRYSILDVLELDRKRIARDLHDSSVQLLTMLVHKAELCEKLLDIDIIRTKMELHTMGECLKDTISELRQTIFDLRPMTMDDLGLMDSIERYLQMLIQSSEIQFRIQVINEKGYDIEEVLNPVEKLSMYRILQECCSNIIKHSKAKKALITLMIQKDCICMRVEDNGIGIQDNQILMKINSMSQKVYRDQGECFDALTSMLRSRENLTGYGLSMLLERVYLLNGTLNIKADEDGTSILVMIPIDVNEEDTNETD